MRAGYTTQHKAERGALPDLHANPATTVNVYDRNKEIKRPALGTTFPRWNHRHWTHVQAARDSR